MTKRGLLVVTILLLALLLMGNMPAPNAFCLGKAPGDQCMVTGTACFTPLGTCQPDPTGYWSDDPSTPDNEGLLCITGRATPASPLEPTAPPAS